MEVTAVERLIFAARHRVVLAAAPAGDGAAVARQLDAVLMCAGFKCSRQLLERLAEREPQYLVDKAVQVIGWARELAGDHVGHNPYFIDFPHNVPDTLEFWSGLLADAVRQHAETGQVTVDGVLGPDGIFALNLLSLPGYGRYQHTFGEMLARHDELIPALSDRVTVLHPGGSLADEASELFGELAGSTVPLSGERLGWLRLLADALADATVFPEGAVFPGGMPTWGGGVRVEENKPTVKILVRSVLARDYLRVEYLAGLLRAKADSVTIVNGDAGTSGDVIQGPGPVTYLGVAPPPSGLPDGSAAYTRGNLGALIPA